MQIHNTIKLFVLLFSMMTSCALRNNQSLKSNLHGGNPASGDEASDVKWIFVPGASHTIGRTNLPGLGFPRPRVLRQFGPDTEAIKYPWLGSPQEISSVTAEKLREHIAAVGHIKLFCHSLGTFACASVLKLQDIAENVEEIVMFAPVFGDVNGIYRHRLHKDIAEAKNSPELLRTLEQFSGQTTYIIANRDLILESPEKGVPIFATNEAITMDVSHGSAAVNPTVIRQVLQLIRTVR
jgi:hypothetical protein